MKMKSSKNVIVIMFIISILFPMGAQTSAAASKYVKLEIQWEDGRTTRIETLRKDGVTYGSLFSLGDRAGLNGGMENDNMAYLKRGEKHIVVHMGSSMAEVDGQEVDMGKEPVWYISNLYVPIRFLASALDGEVASQDTKTGKVTVTGLKNYTDSFDSSMSGYNYMIQAAIGDLEITNAFTGKKDTIPLGINDINVNTHKLTLNLTRSPENLTILTINYTNRKTGEYDLYTLLFKNRGMIRKSIAHGLTESHEILKSDGTLSLIDDNNIRFIDDGSGDVLEVIARN